GVAASKATWQPIKSKVISEPNNHGNMQKHGAPKVSIFAKEYPCNKLHVKKGGPHDGTSKLSVFTSNPYDVLDNMESEEEVVVFYESANLNGTRMGASSSKAPDGPKT
nr:hypothetical protein [Tanacetum cinerariifolium]